MELKLYRRKLTDQSTQGSLFINDKFTCFTLEDRQRDLSQEPKVSGQTAIPEGKYRVVLDWSNRFQKTMPHILDVPYFEGIRIHPGNTDKDTEGCILVGLSRAPDYVGNSQDAYNKLFPLLKAAVSRDEQISIEIILDEFKENWND